MTKLQFDINKKLHKELATTCSKLGMRRPNFYVNCMEKGLDEHRRCIQQSDWHDMHVTIARAIYAKTDTAEDHEQQFDIEEGNLNIKGTIGYESIETWPETQLEQAESKTTVVMLSVSVYDVENEKDVNVSENKLTDFINDLLQ